MHLQTRVKVSAKAMAVDSFQENHSPKAKAKTDEKDLEREVGEGGRL